MVAKVSATSNSKQQHSHVVSGKKERREIKGLLGQGIWATRLGCSWSTN
jgi:hypothetical protein